MQIYRKIKITKKRVIIAAIVLVAVAVFCFIQNNWLVVSEYSYNSDKLNEYDGFRIVQISDLHNAKFGPNNKWLIDKIKARQPDIIVITGDIADANHTNLDTAVEFCNEAAKICPCFYITGNHELWLDDDEQSYLYEGIEKSGVKILQNEIFSLNDEIELIGLGDESLYNGTLEALEPKFDRNKLNLLLAHEPQYFDDYCACGPDLILVGHAHGGQVRLPFVGGLVAPDQGFLPEYTEGEFVKGDTKLIISRGLGNSVIPLRVFNLPEIVVVTLTK